MIGFMLVVRRAIASALAFAFVSFATCRLAHADDDSWFDQQQPAPAAQPEDAPPPPSDTTPPPGPTPRGLASVRHASTQAGASGSIDAEDANPDAVQRWRPSLAPYGQWVDDPNYGLIWVPDRGTVGEHFAPYVTSGHWELDVNNEWVWVSDYPFGDVVFHYGRWVWIDPMGWAWIPGNRYASAWVVWRVPDDEYAYVGWAPAPVSFVWIGGSAVFCSWYHPVGFVYVSSYYAFSYQPSRYIVRDPALRRQIAGHTRRLPANPGYGAARAPSLAQARVPPTAAPLTRRPAFSGSSPMVNRGLQRTNPVVAQRGTPTFRSTPLPAGRPAATLARPASPTTWSTSRSTPAVSSARPASPTWSAPRSPAYRAPSYHAPSAPSYRAPSYHSVPSSAPHWSGGGGRSSRHR